MNERIGLAAAALALPLVLGACATVGGPGVSSYFDCGEGKMLKVTYQHRGALVQVDNGVPIALKATPAVQGQIYAGSTGWRLAVNGDTATWSGPHARGAGDLPQGRRSALASRLDLPPRTCEKHRQEEDLGVRTMRYAIALGAATILAPAIAPSAQAHHSMAMFDSNKEITLQGTVREFQWTNPHAYIQLMTQGSDGKPVEWSMEMGSPMYLYARGWRPGSLKAGAKVTIRGYPLRDGHHGGVVLDVTDADGHKIGTNQ